MGERREMDLIADDTEYSPGTTDVPGVTVVLLSPAGAKGLADCLTSLADQQPVPGLLEVVLVLFGTRPFALGESLQIRRQYPGLRLRVVSRRGSSRSAAREAGIAAARCQYLTILDGNDTVGPAFLRTLHEAARPGVVPMIEPAGIITAAVGDERPVRVLSAEEFSAALAFDGGKLVPAAWARNIQVDHATGRRADAWFWAQLVARTEFSLQVLDAAPDAAYHRHQAEGGAPRFAELVTEPIAAIEGIECATDIASRTAAAALSAWAGGEAAALHAYLQAHPDHRPRVVEALDDSVLIRVPSRELNRGMATGLVISYCFPPYVDTAGVVAAKRVRQRGEVVDVIYNSMGMLRDLEISTQRIAGPFVSDEAAIASPTAFASWVSIDSFRELGIAQIEAWEEEKGPYQTVYSRAQFAASHFLAADYKLRRPAVRWTAEFSDPLSRDVHGNERGEPAGEGAFLNRLREAFRARGVEPPESDNTFLWCEWVAYLLADEVLFTNVNQRDYMLGCCPAPVADIASAKSVVAPQPTLPPRFYTLQQPEYPIPSDRVNIAYFGNFYATRGLDDFLVAMAGLPEGIRERVCLHVFTSTPGALRDRGSELGLTEQLRIGPYVGYLDFLNLTTRFDCLLVNDAVTDPGVRNPFLPSKLSDYRGSGSRVWGLVEEGSPLSAEPLAYASPVGDVDAARRVLADLAAGRDRDHFSGAMAAG